MKPNWQYQDAASHKVGRMVCGVCGKPIAQGRFRYHDPGFVFRIEHEVCSGNDPQWAKLDAMTTKPADVLADLDDIAGLLGSATDKNRIQSIRTKFAALVEAARNMQSRAYLQVGPSGRNVCIPQEQYLTFCEALRSAGQ